MSLRFLSIRNSILLRIALGGGMEFCYTVQAGFEPPPLPHPPGGVLYHTQPSSEWALGGVLISLSGAGQWPVAPLYGHR